MNKNYRRIDRDSNILHRYHRDLSWDESISKVILCAIVCIIIPIKNIFEASFHQTSIAVAIN